MKESAVYTRGPIGRTMLRTAFAMLAGTLAMSGYNIVDTYFVGNLGKIPMAAMGFTFPVIMLIGCVFRGLGIGMMTTAAHAVGRGRKKKAAILISNGILLTVLFSILLAVLGMMSSRWIFRMLGASEEVLPQVVAYMDIWYFGCVTASLSMTGNDLLIAVGDSGRASMMMVIGLILNAVLDPVFIFGWGGIPAMGIRGAALATVIAQFVAAFLVLYLLWRQHRLLRFGPFPWRELKSSWNMVIRFAVPSSLGMLMMPVGSAVVTWIAGRLEMVAFVFPMALGISITPMVGQNFGARLYDRIRACRKFAMRFAFLFLLGMALIYFFAAEFLVRQFSPDPEVRKIMVTCMHIIPWGFGMVEIHRFSGFFYTGCGRPAISAWLNAFRILGLMIPFSFAALAFHSLEGLFYARLASDLCAGTVGFLLARRMVERLPRNGEPPEIPVADWNIWKKCFRIFQP
ncbi:MAG: Multidrug resistance protein NorM [Lentisphaerae bacterium ADurb.Bin242]|nr:MAG: Multidrug resistance protein NorM [Lentisphaerae bacterium ADurb.Bin242]